MSTIETHPPVEPTLIYVANVQEFTIMSELIDCTDIGFTTQTFVFNDKECLRRAIEIFREHNVTFYEL